MEQLYDTLQYGTPPAPDMVLVGAISDTTSTMTVDALPANVTAPNFRLRIGKGTDANEEFVKVTAISGLDLTIVRESDLSAFFPKCAHADGAAVYLPPTAGGITQWLADRIATLPDFAPSGGGHARGLVPDPGASAGATKYLREDASWGVPPGTAASVFLASGAAHAAGLVPDPGATAGTTKYLREDASWGVPPGAAVPTFIASGGTHAAGLVPDPGATAGATKYLREDATWVVPPAGGLKSARAVRTAGDIAFTATAWAEVSSSIRCTVPAAAGDVLQVSPAFYTQETLGLVTFFDIATVVSGAVLNHFGTTADGLIAILALVPAAPHAGSFQYVVQAGDVSAGTVTVTLIAKNASAGTKTITGGTDADLRLSVVNLGQ